MGTTMEPAMDRTPGPRPEILSAQGTAGAAPSSFTAASAPDRQQDASMPRQQIDEEAQIVAAAQSKQQGETQPGEQLRAQSKDLPGDQSGSPSGARVEADPVNYMEESAGSSKAARTHVSAPDSARDPALEAADLDKRPRMRLCIVTGLSGSGKSTAMQVFEDLQYFTVDGLPASMAPEMVELMKCPGMSHFKGMALGLDIRQSTFLDEIEEVINTLRQRGHVPQLIFFEAETAELMRRYATTRRPHPLEREGIGLEAAVLNERKRLARLRSLADMVINTTRFSIHDLRRVIQKRFRDEAESGRALRVFVLSFGFKHEVPHEADYVFDLRFLPNPYFVSDLRAKTGLDQDVADYVFATPKAREFLAKLQDLFAFLLPIMESEGRYRLTLAFGCTGGHHRSVAVAEAMGRAIAQQGFSVSIEHRHLNLG